MKNALKVYNNQHTEQLLNSTNALAVHLTSYGFTVAEAIWLIAHFGDKMARWRLQVTSSEKEEIFSDVTDPNVFIQRWIE